MALVAIVGMLGVLIGKKSNPTPNANPTPKSNDSASLPISASLGVGMVGGVKAYYAVLLALVLGASAVNKPNKRSTNPLTVGMPQRGYSVAPLGSLLIA